MLYISARSASIRSASHAMSSCQVGNQNREKLRIKPFERWSRKERRREPQTSSIQSSRHGPRWWSLAGLLARLRIQNFQSYLRSIFHGILYEITIKPISGSKCGSVDDDMTGPRCATSPSIGECAVFWLVDAVFGAINFKSQPPVILDIESWVRHGGRRSVYLAVAL